MKLIRRAGATSQIFQIFIADSSSTTGAGLTGLTNGSGSLTAYYHRDTDTTATAISLVSMTVGTFTSSGFKEIDATNMPGWYQFCPPNAALASGAASCAFHLKGATNMAPLPIEVDLDSQVDVYLWNGTAVSSPATAGIPDVNVKNMNNVAATSITTINANQGTTQPLNFTGTAGSALVKSDMVDVAGAAVSTTTAQIGVNAVQINAVATTSVTTVNANVGTTQPVNFTGTAGSALVKGDTVDIAGAAVSTTTAQIGVNAVQINTVSTSSVTAVNANQGTTQPINFTGTGASALVKSDASGTTVGANVTQWNGTNVATPATAGIPEVNIKNVNNQTATAAAGVTFPSSIASPTNITAGIITTVSGNVVGSVGSVVADVGITQAGADKVFGPSGAAMAELSGVPSATPNPRNAVMLVFMALRNKLTTTASLKSIFNDAGSAITTKALSDDSTTYTEDKMV